MQWLLARAQGRLLIVLAEPKQAAWVEVSNGIELGPARGEFLDVSPELGLDHSAWLRSLLPRSPGLVERITALCGGQVAGAHEVLRSLVEEGALEVGVEGYDEVRSAALPPDLDGAAALWERRGHHLLLCGREGEALDALLDQIDALLAQGREAAASRLAGDAERAVERLDLAAGDPRLARLLRQRWAIRW